MDPLRPIKSTYNLHVMCLMQALLHQSSNKSPTKGTLFLLSVTPHLKLLWSEKDGRVCHTAFCRAAVPHMDVVQQISEEVFGVATRLQPAGMLLRTVMDSSGLPLNCYWKFIPQISRNERMCFLRLKGLNTRNLESAVGFYGLDVYSLSASTQVQTRAKPLHGPSQCLALTCCILPYIIAYP